jgi:nitrate/nitrite-specific signal transduction histidine kinase
MNPYKSQRSRFIINPRFQYRFIAMFIAVSIAMSAAILTFAWTSYSSFTSKLAQKQNEMSLYTDMVNEFMESGVTVFWVPQEFKKEFFIKLVAFTALLSLAIVLIAILISHRIAGPLFRLNNFMLAVSEDQPVPHLRFRDKDEFQNLAESFNKCVERLASKYDEEQKIKTKLVEELKSCLDQTEVKTSLQQVLDKYRL